MSARKIHSPADVVPAHGFTGRGQLYVRGHRVHCGECGYLSNVMGYRVAMRRRSTHRCPK